MMIINTLPRVLIYMVSWTNSKQSLCISIDSLGWMLGGIDAGVGGNGSAPLKLKASKYEVDLGLATSLKS